MFEAMTCSSSSRLPRRLPSAATRLKTLRRGRIARDHVVAVEGDPVADGREVGMGERREPEGTRDRHSPLARAVANDRRIAMDRDDPCRAETLGRERREGLRPAGIPAEGRERRRVRRHLSPPA